MSLRDYEGIADPGDLRAIEAMAAAVPGSAIEDSLGQTVVRVPRE